MSEHTQIGYFAPLGAIISLKILIRLLEHEIMPMIFDYLNELLFHPIRSCFVKCPCDVSLDHKDVKVCPCDKAKENGSVVNAFGESECVGEFRGQGCK